MERQSARVQREQGDAAAAAQRARDGLPLQRAEQPLRPRELAVEHRSKRIASGDRLAHGVEGGVSPPELPEAKLLEAARETLVPHRDRVVFQQVARAPGPARAGLTSAAGDLERRGGNQLGGIRQAAEPPRGLRRTGQDRRRVGLLRDRFEPLAGAAAAGKGQGEAPDVVGPDADATGHVTPGERAFGGVEVDIAVESVLEGTGGEARRRRGVPQLEEILLRRHIPPEHRARWRAHLPLSAGWPARSTRVRIPFCSCCSPRWNPGAFRTRSNSPESRYQ
jgi:hypothetical protein